MPRQITKLTVFISCPENLGTERDIVKSVLPEINQALEQTCGVVLDAISWKDLIPGVGSDGQDVVSGQLADEAYDIYLGILGTRFGDPTPRAGSGTEEEFNQAYQRYCSDPPKVRILFYFKDSLEQGVLKLDPDQLRKVQAFRSKLEAAGVLHAQFTSSDGFLKLVKDHLIGLVTKQWDKGGWRVLSSLPLPGATLPDALIKLKASDVIPDDQDPTDTSAQMPGLDAVILVVESMKLAAEALGRMTELVENMNLTMQIETEKVQKIKADAKPTSPQTMKVLIDGFARDLHDFGVQLRREVAAFRSGTEAGLTATERVIDFQVEELHSDLSSLREAYKGVLQYVGTIRNTRDLTQQFRDSIATLPSYTSALRRGRAQVVDTLDQFQASVAVVLDKLETIERKLGGPLDATPWDLQRTSNPRATSAPTFKFDYELSMT